MKATTTFSIIPALLLLLAACAGPSPSPQSEAAAHYDYRERSAQGLLEDEKTELALLDIISKDPELREHAHINVNSYNGWLLLTGEVPDKDSGFKLVAQARQLPAVRRVFNHLHVGPPSSLAERGHDTWLTTKVKTRLFGDDLAEGTVIKVISERGVVYLMGLVKRAQAERSVALARKSDGVRAVVNLMQYSR